MKAILANVVAVPFLLLSAPSFADEPVVPVSAEPLMLSAVEMDGVTAGDPYEITINNAGFLQIANLQGAGGTSYIYFPAIVYHGPVALEPSVSVTAPAPATDG